MTGYSRSYNLAWMRFNGSKEGTLSNMYAKSSKTGIFLVQLEKNRSLDEGLKKKVLKLEVFLHQSQSQLLALQKVYRLLWLTP
jgi:hypothetical protein